MFGLRVGPLEPIPHDLGHFVIERELDLQDGFWATVAGGGIFEGMQIVAGRQQPHALERSRALMKTHHRGIIFSETVVEAVMRSVNGEPLGTVALPVDHPGLPLRASADRLAVVTRLRPLVPLVADARARWQAVPLGDPFLVIWPDEATRGRRRGGISSVPHR